MFIKGKRWCTRSGEQRASGPFLILLTHNFLKGNREIKCMVRTVAMRQAGHFMMGDLCFNFGDKKYYFSVSGTYGADGLTKDVEELRLAYSPERAPAEVIEAVWDGLMPLPRDIAEMKWKSTSGWNCAGDEGSAVHEWAEKNLIALRRAPKDTK
jgi:hypothetical protein